MVVQFTLDTDIVASLVRDKRLVQPFRSLTDLFDEFLLATVGRLWLGGVDPDFATIRGPGRRRKVPLPGYQFDRDHYWVERGNPLNPPVPIARLNIRKPLRAVVVCARS